MSDKEYLLEISRIFKEAECNRLRIIEVSKELAEEISIRLKEIADKIDPPTTQKRD